MLFNISRRPPSLFSCPNNLFQETNEVTNMYGKMQKKNTLLMSYYAFWIMEIYDQIIFKNFKPYLNLSLLCSIFNDKL